MTSSSIPTVGLTDERLEEIAERCKGVTPGPWGEGDKWVFASPRSGNPSHALEHIFRNEEAQANVAYVARLDPQTVLSLVTELQHSRAEEAVAWRAKSYSRDEWAYAATPAIACELACRNNGLTKALAVAEAEHERAKRDGHGDVACYAVRNVIHAIRLRLAAPASSGVKAGVTEAMVDRAMDRAAWTVKPSPPEYETGNGALIDLGISQDEADHLNAELRGEMREILTAALSGVRDEKDDTNA